MGEILFKAGFNYRVHFLDQSLFKEQKIYKVTKKQGRKFL